MKIPIKEVGKVLLNSIFPFFEDSKALKLIKEDALEVKEELFAKLYDKVKAVFVKDSAKETIFEMLQKKPEDKGLQAATDVNISEELKNNKEFHRELAEYVKEIEKEYSTQTSEIINKLKVEGEGNILEVGGDNELENGAKIKNKANIKGNENQVFIGGGNKLK